MAQSKEQELNPVAQIVAQFEEGEITSAKMTELMRKQFKDELADAEGKKTEAKSPKLDDIDTKVAKKVKEAQETEELRKRQELNTRNTKIGKKILETKGIIKDASKLTMDELEDKIKANRKTRLLVDELGSLANNEPEAFAGTSKQYEEVFQRALDNVDDVINGKATAKVKGPDDHTLDPDKGGLDPGEGNKKSSLVQKFDDFVKGGKAPNFKDMANIAKELEIEHDPASSFFTGRIDTDVDKQVMSNPSYRQSATQESAAA